MQATPTPTVPTEDWAANETAACPFYVYAPTSLSAAGDQAQALVMSWDREVPSGVHCGVAEHVDDIYGTVLGVRVSEETRWIGTLGAAVLPAGYDDPEYDDPRVAIPASIVLGVDDPVLYPYPYEGEQSVTLPAGALLDVDASLVARSYIPMRGDGAEWVPARTEAGTEGWIRVAMTADPSAVVADDWGSSESPIPAPATTSEPAERTPEPSATATPAPVATPTEPPTEETAADLSTPVIAGVGIGTAVLAIAAVLLARLRRRKPEDAETADDTGVPFLATDEPSASTAAPTDEEVQP